MSINTNVLNFYIEHNLINAVSAVLKDSSIEEFDRTNIVNGIYSHYNSISSESLKNSLLQMYVKHEFYSVVIKILEQDGTTYSNIDSICTAINEYGSEDFRNRVKEDFLDYSNLLDSDFISSNLERAAYIYLNSDLEDVCNLIIDSLSFINKVISCYKYSKHYEWLNYIISHNNAMAYKLWINGISFDDDQLKSINLLASTDDSDNPFYYVNFIRDLRINPIDQYVKCSCSAVIKPFIESNIQINSTSYSVIDSSCNDTLFESLFGDTVQFTIQNYSSSLLRKVNDFGLTHIFSYLKSNGKISNDVLEYLLNRSDCNANIKVLALCSFTAADLTPGLKSSNYSLYLEIFRAVLYNDFLYGALHDSLSLSQRNDFDTNYCNEVAKCTSESNLLEIFQYVYSKECYNILACLIYEKDLTSNDYTVVKQLSSNNYFKQALEENIGDSATAARRSYKLLEHDCIDLFNCIVQIRLIPDQCDAFCYTDSHYMYSKYRDYIVSYLNEDTDNYSTYGDYGQRADPLYNVLLLKVFTSPSASRDYKLLRFIEKRVYDEATIIEYYLNITASALQVTQSTISGIIKSFESEHIVSDSLSPTIKEQQSAGFILKWLYNKYISDYSLLKNDFIKICEYCYHGFINYPNYSDSFVYALYDNKSSIIINDIPFGVKSYSCKNLADYLANSAIPNSELVTIGSISIIAIRLINSNYISDDGVVRQYIIDNWIKFIPYITEGYQYGCKFDGTIKTDLKNTNFSDNNHIGYGNNGSVTYNGESYHPISECYIQYTKIKIGEKCASITKNLLS